MNFWRIIAWMVLIFLVGTAFYLFPAETISLDSPLTRGWLDLDTDTVYGHMLLAGLGAVSIVSLVVSVYYTSMRHFMHSSDSGNLLIIFLLLLFQTHLQSFFHRFVSLPSVLFGRKRYFLQRKSSWDLC